MYILQQVGNTEGDGSWQARFLTYDPATTTLETTGAIEGIGNTADNAIKDLERRAEEKAAETGRK